MISSSSRDLVRVRLRVRGRLGLRLRLRRGLRLRLRRRVGPHHVRRCVSLPALFLALISSDLEVSSGARQMWCFLGWPHRATPVASLCRRASSSLCQRLRTASSERLGSIPAMRRHLKPICATGVGGVRDGRGGKGVRSIRGVTGIRGPTGARGAGGAGSARRCAGGAGERPTVATPSRMMVSSAWVQTERPLSSPPSPPPS
eukprot:scaffold17855_cov52-Phaeocystis_antarctica.AAC.1